MMFSKRIVYFFFAVTLVFFAGNHQLMAQLPDYGKLAEYLKSESIDRATAPLITDYLERSGTDQPLEELVRWAQAGFPEFHDKNDIWHINAGGFHLNFEHSLYYYVEQYPATERGARYFRLIGELKKYGRFTHQLTQNAYKFVSREELEAEFYRLVRSKDPEERSRAFPLGLTLAERSKDIASVYFQAARNEQELQPRNSALVYIAMTHSVYPREIALAGLDRLLHDTDKRVRDFGGVLVRQSADFRSVWTEQDLAMLLWEMVKSGDAETRRTLAMTVARLTTPDKTLYIDEKKWEEHPEDKFLALVGPGGTKEHLVEVWREWWTPLIPEYMFKSIPTICRKK